VQPVVEKLDLPPEYGNPTERLTWEDVRAKLESAAAYWVASTRPDGRPHVVPRDGVWFEDALYYGGSPQTVHSRNLEGNRNVAMHIGDGQNAIIVEGAVQHEKLGADVAARLAEASFAKYPGYGRVDPSLYTSAGVWVLRPRRVLAWTNLPINATRFRFEGS